MGQCVSRKAGAVIAASGYSPSYRIMEKKPSKNQGDNKNASKKGAPHTRGTAISFGFRKRLVATGIPVSLTSKEYHQEPHQRSKSVGPEHESRRRQADDDYYQPSSRYQNYSSSGRSTPRLAPPKKESSGLPIRTNRFGFRSQHQKFTDKVTDLSFNNHNNVSDFNDRNQDKVETFQNLHRQHHQPRHNEYQEDVNFKVRQNRSPHSQQIKSRPTSANQSAHNNSSNFDANRMGVEFQGHASKYTLHSSHLPLPQYAVRMADASSKSAKTVANQNRKVGNPPRSMVGTCSSKEGSGTEDSGVGSQHGGCSDENGTGVRSRYEYYDGRQTHNKPRKLGVMLNGKSFDVRDVGDDHTVTEISVITLPKNFAQPPSHHASPNLNLNTGLVRERANQYQRAIFNKDNRYTDSTTSMSTTSSEGFDEGLGEEKAYKDRARTEKLVSSSSSSMVRSADFSPPSSDEQEFGHGGEAMADEYSFSSNDDYNQRLDALPIVPCNTVTQTTSQHFKAISNAAKSGALPKSTLRSVLLTIEDPAFAAVAATTTTLIDDETSPVDSLFDSPTASVSQSDVKVTKKEKNFMERSGNTIEDDSPGTPTNASNSLSLSEGREFFDDEIADQPGLVFDETLRDTSTANTEQSQTIMEIAPKLCKSVENSPVPECKRNRAGSVNTLSSCESLASDDLMMDYERSDASSFGDTNSRGNSTFEMQDLDDATSLLELEIQGQEVMKEWQSLLGQSNQSIANNNINAGLNNNQNADSGLSNNRTTRLLHSRSNTESPKSLDSTRSRQIFSPLRPPRSIQSPSLDSGDEGSLRLERGTYNYMFQDIVSIKTMLLKLKRVLQESEENGLTRSDTLNPFENSLKNGLFYNLNDGNATTDSSTSPNDGRDAIVDELADLRRQVVFLQGQVDDKDRTIESLQSQLTKYQSPSGAKLLSETTALLNGSGELRETSNATTQTEKLRPVSAGPSLLQGLTQDNGMGSVVSWNDSWGNQQQGSGHRPESSSSSTTSSIASTTGRPSSRRSSSDSQQQPRVSNIRGLRPPETPRTRASRSVKTPEEPSEPTTPTRSAIPTPRRLLAPTLIPRPARAQSHERPGAQLL
ncbi:PREDICTED: uncharacterized protein LOC105367587 isoform X2 [Ceratosolen solmsi marchali]|uniref:Uncharacterized protein LOC105367587 isoform X2 n=1 Tax=Ceratosolen solmsi marchali TaxID=326594 RepID=A0AAJ7E1S1_9HYME|nr:PREDICTED: uncharacterized protein LOC105367587 isoform X2 [Ceratosolen solmsi marchali]XP_011504654.1 PREDICTED: uncharacterized protein LOC105367587 isoform X2 [Ceratosolen solmsi marchali]